MKKLWKWIYDYIGIRIILFLFTHYPMFTKARVKYGVRHSKATVEVWINYTKDDKRHTAFYEGHPTDVVYNLTALGDMIHERQQ